MQSRTSFYRFVREHLMGNAQSSRQNLTIQPDLLFDHPTGFVLRAFGRTAHVLYAQFLGREHRACLDHARGFLVQEIEAEIADPLMHLRHQSAEPPVPDGATLLACLLTLKIGYARHLVAHEPRVADRLAVIEGRPIVEAEVHAAVCVAGTGTCARIFRYPKRDRGEPIAISA